MAEGLKEEYTNGGRDSMEGEDMRTFPDHIAGESPHSDEVAKLFLRDLKLSNKWKMMGNEISPKLLGQLKELVTGLPTIPLNRIAKYQSHGVLLRKLLTETIGSSNK